MATITVPSRVQHNGRIFDGVIRTAVTFFQGVNDGLDMAHDYHRLSRMSDEALHKRGLTRAEIGQAVALGRAGK
jgi:hypothetical protein